MRGFIIILAVALFSLWIWLCIHYAKSTSTFIKNTFLKFIGKDEEKNDVK